MDIDFDAETVAHCIHTTIVSTSLAFSRISFHNRRSSSASWLGLARPRFRPDMVSLDYRKGSKDMEKGVDGGQWMRRGADGISLSSAGTHVWCWSRRGMGRTIPAVLPHSGVRV